MAAMEPHGMKGQQLLDFQAGRRKARAALAEIRSTLLLDERPDG